MILSPYRLLFPKLLFAGVSGSVWSSCTNWMQRNRWIGLGQHISSQGFPHFYNISYKFRKLSWRGQFFCSTEAKGKRSVRYFLREFCPPLYKTISYTQLHKLVTYRPELRVWDREKVRLISQIVAVSLIRETRLRLWKIVSARPMLRRVSEKSESLVSNFWIVISFYTWFI